MRAVVVLTQQHASVRSEFLALVEASNYKVVFVCWVSLKKIDAAYYIGRGFVDYLKSLAADLKPDVLLLDVALSARHTRNIQKHTCVDVHDRTELILHIFERRAVSFEGKLQVELAQLNYMATKLVRGWTHLERQRGGIGLRGGPGETQIEVDRRLLRERIRKVKQKISSLSNTRQLNRQHRQRKNVFNIAIVGYTNAGKSSLFNLMTHQHVQADNQLFVTLDAKTRTLRSDQLGSITLSDTVGFIDDLPKPLLEAFASTLEEIKHADLLLHVVDGADQQRSEKIRVVDAMLAQLGADNVPTFLVYNKIDLVDHEVVTLVNEYAISVTQASGVDKLTYDILAMARDRFAS